MVSLPLGLAGTTLVCHNWYTWIPDLVNNRKYILFRDIRGPNDTIFGWLSGRFVGQQDSCNVVMYVDTAGYNSAPNSQVFAGERSTTTTLVDEHYSSTLQVYPTVVDDKLFVQNTGGEPVNFRIFDLLGNQTDKPVQIDPGVTISLDVANHTAGVYIIAAETATSISSQKIIVK